MSWFCNFCTSKEQNQILISNYSFSQNSSKDNTTNYKPGKHRSLSALHLKFIEEKSIHCETNKNIYPNKSPFICLFCNGKKCKSENYLTHPNPAIPGLNSDLYNNCIYASQRPSNVLIKKFNLISFFKEHDIKLVINLQVPGEHPFCGPHEGLDLSSGFSYTPALFISEGIKVKIAGWNDLESPSNYEIMLEIVKEMSLMIKVKKKKVFVHCHAGNGRTGLVIACYFIYDDPEMTSEKAIALVREKRKKGVEKKEQEEYCKNFEIYIRKKREIFTKNKIDICTVIKNQFDLQYLSDGKVQNSLIINPYLFLNETLTDNPIINLKYVPRLIYICLERIIYLVNNNKVTDQDIYKALSGSIEITEMTSKAIEIVIKRINQNDFNLLEQSESIVIISEILFIWLNESVKYVVNPKKIYTIFTEMSSDPLQKKTNCQTIGSIIENFRIETESKINEAINVIISVLSKIEFETLKFISQFLFKIYPLSKENTTMIEEYKLMLQKFLIFILGYNLDLFIDNEKKSEKEKLIVEQAVSLIEFFIFYKKSDDKSNGGMINSSSKSAVDFEEIINNNNNLEMEYDDKKLYDIYLNLKKKFEKNDYIKKNTEDSFFSRKQLSNLKRNSCFSINLGTNNNSSILGPTQNKKKEGNGVVFSKVEKYYCI